MGTISLSFALQTLEGSNSNVVTLSRTGSYAVAGFNSNVFETLTVASGATDLQIQVPATANKVLTIENTGAADVTVKFNNSSGTGFVIPKQTGFMAMVTTTAVTSLYVTNADGANQGMLKFFIGG